MATAYTFAQILPYSSYPAKYEPGLLYSIDFEYTLAGSVVTGDNYSTPSGGLPTNGIRIVDTALIFTPLDTNATPTATISVGDSGSATRFINAANAGSATSNAQLHLFINQAQGLTAGVVSSGSGYLYGSNTTPVLKVTVGGTVATAQTTGVIRLRVSFYCSGEQ
jgi:hypothetical protein